MAAAVTTAATASVAASTTPAKISLGGPIYLFLQFIGYATVAGAIAVVIDSLRRPEADFGGNRAGRWMWAGPQLLLLALIALSWLMSITGVGSASAVLDTMVGFLVLYLFFCAMLQIAYLLVVVFPRHREPLPPEIEDELPKE